MCFAWHMDHVRLRLMLSFPREKKQTWLACKRHVPADAALQVSDQQRVGSPSINKSVQSVESGIAHGREAETSVDHQSHG